MCYGKAAGIYGDKLQNSHQILIYWFAPHLAISELLGQSIWVPIVS